MNARTLTGSFCGLALVSTLLLAGCTSPADNSPADGVTDGSGQSGGTGTLRVVVTDKPFPFEFISQALVTITSVEVRIGDDDGNHTDGNENDNANSNENDNGDDNENDNGDEGNDNEGDEENDNGDEGNDNADDDDDDGDDDDGDDDGSFIVIFEGQRVLNLLDLQNGRTDLLVEADIPAGTYTQMRLIVAEGEITLTDDRVFPLEVPSGEQTGIKLHFTFTIEADQETVLLLDVDLSKAFKPVPGGQIDDVSTIREFKFSPSVAMKLIELVDAGSIAGTVSDPETNPLGDVSVTAFEGDDEITSTATEDDGTYTLSGLAAGTYRVEFSASGYEDAEVADVEVIAGETTDGVDVTLIPVP